MTPKGLLLSYTAGDALKRGVSKLTPPGESKGSVTPPARIPASMVEGVVPRGAGRGVMPCRVTSAACDMPMPMPMPMLMLLLLLLLLLLLPPNSPVCCRSSCWWYFCCC